MRWRTGVVCAMDPFIQSGFVVLMTLGESSSLKRLANEARAFREATPTSDSSPWNDRVPSRRPSSESDRFGGVMLRGDSGNSWLLASATALGEGALTFSRSFFETFLFSEAALRKGLAFLCEEVSVGSTTVVGDCDFNRLSTLSADLVR